MNKFFCDDGFFSHAYSMLAAGAIVVVLVVFFGVEVGGVHIWRRSREELPLLAPQDDQAVPSHATSNSSSIAISTPSGELDEHGGSPRNDQQLCTICLDAPKDCFFDPCGHRCTCYGCGQRSVFVSGSLSS